MFAAARFLPTQGPPASLLALTHTYPSTLHCLPLEITSDESIADAVSAFEQIMPAEKQYLNWIINNAAVCDAGDPPSTCFFGQLSRAALTEIHNTNVISPLMILQAFIPFVRKSTSEKVTCLPF